MFIFTLRLLSCQPQFKQICWPSLRNMMLKKFRFGSFENSENEKSIFSLKLIHNRYFMDYSEITYYCTQIKQIVTHQ